MFARVAILFRIAFANLFASLLNVFVGLVLAFGAALLVIGGSLFTTLDEALEKSIVGSITGHLQVYAARSKDPLEIYGKVDGSDSNLAPIEDFASLKPRLLSVENVATVVPMGSATALVSSGNTVDVALEKLRAVYRNQESEAARLPDEEFQRQAKSLAGHVRNMVEVLAKDLERADELAAKGAVEEAEREAVAKASSAAFWESFDADPFGHLELLENRVAPLVSDADMLFMRCLGTDLDAYQTTFDRMSIVEGGKVPPGHRGILLPRFFTEELLKLKNARRLDKIKEARESGRSLADPADKELARFVKENVAQTREIVLQLDGLQTAKAVEKLQAHLGSQETGLAPLLSRFFAVDEASFEARYRFFYAELAPMLQLYRARVGDELTLKSFGKSGSTESVTVKVYGIFELKGLEKSPLAGVNALIDMVSFRDLYGFLTAEKKAELEAMKAATGAKTVSRENAEAELFGGAGELVEEVKEKPIGADVTKSAQVEHGRVKKKAETFPVEEIDRGVVLHVAVMLKDGSATAQARAAEALERLLSADAPRPEPAKVAAAKALAESGRLPFPLAATVKGVVALEEARAAGAPRPQTAALLGLQQALKAERAQLEPTEVSVVQGLLESARPRLYAVGWDSAAGFLGKFIGFFRMLLVAIVAAFAFIALIVVTIGMTIATLQRTATIGTLRAIGAQRGFVVTMVLVETLVLALTFGAVGAALGVGVVELLHAKGIPAFRDELYFFFSGPVLRPVLTAQGVVLSLVVTLVVSLLSVLLPVVLATRVPPVRALQGGD